VTIAEGIWNLYEYFNRCPGEPLWKKSIPYRGLDCKSLSRKQFHPRIPRGDSIERNGLRASGSLGRCGNQAVRKIRISAPKQLNGALNHALLLDKEFFLE
jgi:hypothetical protein